MLRWGGASDGMSDTETVMSGHYMPDESARNFILQHFQEYPPEGDVICQTDTT